MKPKTKKRTIGMSDWTFEHYQTDVMESLKLLPEMIFYLEPVSGEIVGIRRGVPGYYKCPIIPAGHEESITAKKLNDRAGVTDFQFEAIVNGSMFGWDCRGADVRYLEEQARRKKLERALKN